MILIDYNPSLIVQNLKQHENRFCKLISQLSLNDLIICVLINY